MNEMYERCESCKTLREEGKFELAAKCNPCSGKGFCRSDVTCNMCAQLIEPRGYGLIDAAVDGGYDSTHLSDLTRYRFSLCEKCLKELFDKFQVPPVVTGYHIWDGHDTEVSDEEV